MTRATYPAAILVAAATVLAGCGATTGGSDTQDRLTEHCDDQQPDLTGAAPLEGDPELEGTLTVWGWYNLVPQALVEDFQQLYPNVEFEFVDFSLEDTHTKLLTALNSGTGAPDISMVQDRDGPRFHDLGLLDLRACAAAQLPTRRPSPPTSGRKWSLPATGSRRCRGRPGRSC